MNDIDEETDLEIAEAVEDVCPVAKAVTGAERVGALIGLPVEV